MANLESTQLKDGFQTLVSIGTSDSTNHPSNPLLGALTNGKGNALTQITLGLGSVGAPSYSFTGDADTGMFSSGANALNLVTGGSTAIAIASGGNVAIGTNNISSAKLQVGTSSEEILRLERDTVSNNSFIDLTYAAGHSDDSDANHEYSKIRTKVVANLENSESGELHFQTINSGTMGTAMVIDQAGLVGIGSTSGGVPNPAYALEVQANSTSGVLAVQNAANDRNTFRSSNSGGTRTLDIGNNSSGHGILNIRNSSGTVKAQLVGSGDSYFDAGNVGIGTGSTVDDKLHVVGTSIKIQEKGQTGITMKFNHGNNASTNSDINIANIKSFVTDGSTGNEGGGLAFETKPTSGSATEVMRVDKDGNVGIGTNSPSAKLQVEGDLDVRTASNKNLHIRSFPSFDNFSNQGVGLSMSRTSSDADLMAVGVVDTDKLGLFSRSGIILATGGSNAFQHTSEVVRIDGSGNVGIGTTNPSSILHLENASSPKLIIKDTTNNCQYITYAQNSNAHLGTSSNHDLMIDTNNTTRMTVKAGGNILIGTDDTPNGTSVYGSAFIDGGSNLRQLFQATSTATNVSVQRYYNPNGNVGSIQLTGSSTSFVTSSDYRLKENVVEMTGALDRVDQLKPSRFNFIADADTTVDGFLAHEVANVIPEAITGEKDAVDEEGNPIYQGIDQSKLVPLLVGAIQELKAEIEQLKNK